MTVAAPRALIAEDEPLLAQALVQALAQAWPELQIAAVVGDGLSASRQALALRPDVLFFDIRMPGQGGLQAAAELARNWPPDQALPALVLVTAYDQYAIDAFEAQAVDYLLKPVQLPRLERTVERLRLLLSQRRAGAALGSLTQVLAQWQALAAGALPPVQPPTQPPEPPLPTTAGLGWLQRIPASLGRQTVLVPVADLIYLEAADKYLRLLTAEHEYLVRTPLKRLLARLDPEQFWQVHRATVVQAQAIAAAERDDSGRIRLRLHHRPETLAVSRVYAQRFKAM